VLPTGHVTPIRSAMPPALSDGLGPLTQRHQRVALRL